MKKLLILTFTLTLLSTPVYSRYIPHGSIHNNNHYTPTEMYFGKGLTEKLKGKLVDGCEIIDVVYYDNGANIICIKNGELKYIRIKLFHLTKENVGLFGNIYDYDKEIKELLEEE